MHAPLPPNTVSVALAGERLRSDPPVFECVCVVATWLIGALGGVDGAGDSPSSLPPSKSSEDSKALKYARDELKVIQKKMSEAKENDEKLTTR